MSEITIAISEIKIVSLKKLKMNKNNRNIHPENQLEMLAKHYVIHGVRTPIIVSNQSGLIVSGHGRYLAALRAGLKEMPVSYQDFESKEKEYAFGISDNGLSLWSELDLSAINGDLPDLGPDLDISWLGLENFTLDMSEKEEKEVNAKIPQGACPNCKHVDDLEVFKKEGYSAES